MDGGIGRWVLAAALLAGCTDDLGHANASASVTFFPPTPLELAGSVGTSIRLLLGESPDVLPTVTVADPAMATVDVSGSDWNLSNATVHLLVPGGVHLTARVQGTVNSGETVALLACTDPATSSTPLPTSDLGGEVPGAAVQARLVTSPTEWQAFAAAIRPEASPPTPLDFTEASLVAVVADANGESGAPVVTHRTATSIHVVVPRLNAWPSQKQPLTRRLTLLKVSKVDGRPSVEAEGL